MLERALLFSTSETIEAEDIHFDLAAPAIVAGAVPSVRNMPVVPPAADTRLTLEEVEQRQIASVLEEENGHVERAARRLGIPRSSLYAKIRSGRVQRWRLHEGSPKSSTA